MRGFGIFCAVEIIEEQIEMIKAQAYNFIRYLFEAKGKKLNSFRIFELAQNLRKCGLLLMISTWN